MASIKKLPKAASTALCHPNPDHVCVILVPCLSLYKAQRERLLTYLRVPIYCAASWASLVSTKVAFWIDPFRDVYEAFTLYAFFQLLINFLGGERALIIMMHGRAPVSHLWPLNRCLAKVDISDPHTFLAVKRGILQYTWIKPMLAISTIAMKATGTYQEGYIGLTSGYLWSGIIYNLSITISLYALALFWVCMSSDLKPFRPMPKFLCIKGIIFASYWQGFFLSILVWLGAIPDINGGYSADNLAAAIQDALICFEMPLFALAHWYAFSWHDYADKTISDARMPVKYALRDAFGSRDLIEDAKETFYGTQYEYRYFDAEDNVIAHEQSSSREARMREGMRYGRGGKGKYWLPERSHADSKTPLLAHLKNSRARTMSPGGGAKSPSPSRTLNSYGAPEEPGEPEEPVLDAEEERLYTNARALEFGDWNYPVINTHYASRDDRERAEPAIITASTNRSVLQPSRANRARRKSKIKEIQNNVRKEHRSSHSSSKTKSGKLPVVGELLRQETTTSSHSSKSHSSQLVDLVVEDHEAEEVERVRARKEGGPGWNEVEQKHFVKTYPDAGEGEEVRQGFNPDVTETAEYEQMHNTDMPFTVGEDDEEAEAKPRDELNHEQPWEDREYGNGDDDDNTSPKPQYASFNEERNVWGS
ncbi:organic solute transporter Ostalpha-domain-containing protein [Delphinella strobiligena]|nr:organic solute transporter Ostalpha-domain-containing protein [Delphinella strobiligena]